MARRLPGVDESVGDGDPTTGQLTTIVNEPPERPTLLRAG
jgi:hypothetical protein